MPLCPHVELSRLSRDHVVVCSVKRKAQTPLASGLSKRNTPLDTFASRRRRGLITDLTEGGRSEPIEVYSPERRECVDEGSESQESYPAFVPPPPPHCALLPPAPPTPSLLQQQEKAPASPAAVHSYSQAETQPLPDEEVLCAQPQLLPALVDLVTRSPVLRAASDVFRYCYHGVYEYFP